MQSQFTSLELEIQALTFTTDIIIKPNVKSVGGQTEYSATIAHISTPLAN